MLKKVEEKLDEKGRDALNKWIILFAPLDAALIRGNMERAVNILKYAVITIRDLVPHIQDEKLRETVSTIADNTESMLQSGLNLKNLDGTFRKSTGGIRSILQIVVDKVVKPLLRGVRNLLSGSKQTE